MANMVHAFKDRDVRRVIKAVRLSGLNPVAVEVDPKSGKINISVAGAASVTASVDNEWDQVYDNGAAKAATVR